MGTQLATQPKFELVSPILLGVPFHSYLKHLNYYFACFMYPIPRLFYKEILNEYWGAERPNGGGRNREGQRKHEKASEKRNENKMIVIYIYI